LLRD
jgi:hypothetical protein